MILISKMLRRIRAAFHFLMMMIMIMIIIICYKDEEEIKRKTLSMINFIVSPYDENNYDKA